MKVNSLWYVAPEKIELREIEIPEPGPHELLVKVEACGICTWDLFIYSGGFRGFKDFPFYFGHEGVGTVVKLGPGVTRFEPGDRVALRESSEIGAIGYGHMAEYALQPEEGLVRLPNEQGKPEDWMIEPVACCVNALDLAVVKPGSRVALVGSGYMGGILQQLLAISQASAVCVFDVRPEALSYARDVKQSHDVIEVYDARSDLDPELDGTFDIVFETAATETAFCLANRLVKIGGTLGIFSWHHSKIMFDFGDWHVRGLTVLNTSPAAAPSFTDCFLRSVPLMTRGLVRPAELTTHLGAPEEAPQIYDTGLNKTDGYIKGVIRWS